MSVLVEKIARRIIGIHINRPEKRNALNAVTIKALRRALDDFDTDDECSIAILSGIGGHFCSGYDLNEIVHPQSGLPDMRNIDQMLWPLGLRLSNKKITIASIEGYAAGFGYELALKCDFRVADRDARLGFMNRRFGIPIFNGGTVILPQLIGQARAMELIATGMAQFAPEALQYGAITYIADIGCSLGRSLNLARCLAKFDQSSLLLDIKPKLSQQQQRRILEKLRSERDHALDFLRDSKHLEIATRFLRGELCRHGKYDLDSCISSEVESTL